MATMLLEIAQPAIQRATLALVHHHQSAFNVKRHMPTCSKIMRASHVIVRAQV